MKLKKQSDLFIKFERGIERFDYDKLVEQATCETWFVMAK